MESKLISMFLQLLIIFITPPLFVGIINRVKSIFAGRKGPPILQLYYDIYKLFRKDAVYSKSTSSLFRIIPIFIFVSIICASALLPIVGFTPVSFYGDIILFIYLFAMGRFLIITSAMDVGSSFEGMGASREATFGAFAELTVLIVIATLVVITGSMSFDKIFSVNGNQFTIEPVMILLFFAFFFILLTENSRMPIDDPNTHLELTMIHEVMILDYSGPDLGLILYGSSIKLFVFMVFASLLIFPNSNLGLWSNAGLMMTKVLGISILIGVVESVTARIRLIKIPQLLIASFVLSFFAFIIVVYIRGSL